MTEKTNTGDLVLDRNGYFHVVYLISDEEKLYGMSNYYIGHIDNCTLVLTDEKLQELRKPKDRQPTFAVGEYYSFTTYRKDYDADTNFIFKVLEIKNCGIKVCEYDCHGKNYEEYVYDSDSEFLKGSKPATDEQIKEFKLAEAIAKTGQSADQIRQMLSNGKMPMGPWLELQKTAEELQEVENNG
ncbi:hypothetical protein IGJ55_002105 [Enterococcus sp. AZ170]|uniref:hypothetical protein n=1 Tax=Enterococcus sp. AZ170 TaxID=2774747 RepID=UPI003D2FFB9E